MFSLIIAVLAIALVAILAIASYYFLGDTVNDGAFAAETATLQAQAQQIESAATGYQALKGSPPPDLESLVNASLLRSVPQPGWQAYPSAAIVATVPDEVCLRFNQQRGVPSVPACSDPAYATLTICCTP